MKTKNLVIKGIVTVVLFYFMNITLDVLFYALLIQLLLICGEKLINVLEPITQAKVLKTMSKIRLAKKTEKKIVCIRPFTLIINYVIKFYKHDFTAVEEEA